MPHPDFLILSQPSLATGKTYVIGDVHGEIRAFDAVLNTLTPNDTLIIAGDLIDRGQGEYGHAASQLILDKLLQLHNAAAGTVPKVLAIKGNHEVDFLKLIELLNASTAEPAEMERLVLQIIRNGGIWMFKDISDEQTRYLHLWGALFACQSSGYKVQAELFLREFIRTKLLANASTHDDYLLPNISEYVKYIESLPYIIKIDHASNPGWIVHADLPFTDEELQRRIDNDTGLSPFEVKLVTDTRPVNFSRIRNGDKTAIRVYCGHNIIDEDPKKELYPTLAIRAESNHVNLDGGAYFSGAFLMVNHTDNAVSLISDNSRPHQPFLFTARDSIQRHFDDNPYTPAIGASALTANRGQLLATHSVFASNSARSSSITAANTSKTAKRPKEDMEGEIVESKADVENIDTKTQIK